MRKHIPFDILKKPNLSFIRFSCKIILISISVIYLFQIMLQKEKTVCFYRWQEVNDSAFFNPKFFYGKLRADFESYGYKMIDNIYNNDECMNADILFVIYNEATDITKRVHKENYLVTAESPLLLKRSNTLFQEHLYTKIFTYNPKLITSPRYIYTPLVYKQLFKKKPIINFNQKPYFLVQIASNYYTGGLYHRRRQTARWFLENAPDDILLYGRNWNYLASELSSHGKEALNRQYKGRIPTKEEVFTKAKFSLTYENEEGDGYISEKIQDAFLLGTVPIYLGTDDVMKYIPKECFINRKDFETDEQLYSFLKQVTPEKYKTYTDCIENYLSKPSYFSADKVRHIIIETIFPHPKTFYQQKNQLSVKK